MYDMDILGSTVARIHIYGRMRLVISSWQVTVAKNV